MRAALLAAALTLPLGAAAQNATIAPETRGALEQLLGRALSTDGAYETLRSLTDLVGPRLAGSAGDRAAVAWGLATLKAQGFANVRAEKVMVPHWERGEETGALLAPVARPLALTALGGSVATPPLGVEAEVVEVDSLEAADALGEKARGKIVLFYKRTPRAREGSGYGAVVPMRADGASRAARHGAVGMLIRSVSTSDTRLPHTGAMKYAADQPQIPAAALATPDADLLHRLLQSGQSVRVRFRLTCRTLPDAESANVVGEVLGREKPREIVVVGGHLDSWDLGQGAVDDGAGCAIAMEAARLIGSLGRRPRRTVRVVLFANEENGARGAEAYEKEHQSELDRHVAAIESDSGAGRALGFRWNAGPGSEPVVNELARLLASIGAGDAQKRGDGGVDILPMKKQGVPLLGVWQDASKYFDIHHSADDTFDKVDAEELRGSVAVMAVLAYALADLSEPLPRIPEAERTKKP